MDLHLLRFKASDLRGVHTIDGLELCSRPYLAVIRTQIHSAIERLHHGVREIRHFVHGLDLLRRRTQRGRRIALFASDESRLLRKFSILLALRLRTEVRHGPFVPLDLQGISSLLGGPEAVSNYGNARG